MKRFIYMLVKEHNFDLLACSDITEQRLVSSVWIHIQILCGARDRVRGMRVNEGYLILANKPPRTVYAQHSFLIV